MASSVSMTRMASSLGRFGADMPASPYRTCRKVGQTRRRYRPVTTHAVPKVGLAAICGTMPGFWSSWSADDGEVTCPRCLGRMRQEAVSKNRQVEAAL